MKKPADIEKGFDLVFADAGYQRIDSLIASGPTFDNADYICIEKKTIFELKVLQKDFFEEGGLIHKLGAIIVTPDKIDEQGLGIYQFTLPAENREGKHDAFEEPIRRIIKKANKQLRATKKHFFDGDGSGFILFALNFTSLAGNMVVAMILDLLEREFRAVDGFTLCTMFLPLYMPKEDIYEPYCVSHWFGETSQTMKEELVRLGDAAFQYAEAIGQKIPNPARLGRSLR